MKGLQLLNGLLEDLENNEIEKEKAASKDIEIYVMDMINKKQLSDSEKNNKIVLSRVMNEFNKFLIYNKNLLNYHKHDSRETKFRLYLESMPKMIEIEYNTLKQRSLLSRWNGSEYTLEQRDVAYIAFYKLVYQSFNALCDFYYIKRESIVRLK